MKLKNIFFGIFCFLTLTTYAQTDDNQIESESYVSEFKLETTSLQDLQDFDWSMIQELFQDNGADQEIKVAFAYKNEAEAKDSEVKIDNFSVEFTGKTSDLPVFIANSKAQVSNMIELSEKY